MHSDGDFQFTLSVDKGPAPSPNGGTVEIVFSNDVTEAYDRFTAHSGAVNVYVPGMSFHDFTDYLTLPTEYSQAIAEVTELLSTVGGGPHAAALLPDQQQQKFVALVTHAEHLAAEFDRRFHDQDIIATSIGVSAENARSRFDSRTSDETVAIKNALTAFHIAIEEVGESMYDDLGNSLAFTAPRAFGTALGKLLGPAARFGVATGRAVLPQSVRQSFAIAAQRLQVAREAARTKIRDALKLGRRSSSSAKCVVSNGLPGPKVPSYHANNFTGGKYVNRQVSGDEVFYKYHGVNNRTGRTHNYVTKKKYGSEIELRNDLAILDEWGVQIDRVTTFRPARGTWISEGTAARQVGEITGEVRPGGGWQGLIDVGNLPNSSVIRTDRLPRSFFE